MKTECPFCGTLCFDNCQDEYKEMMQHIKSHVNENKELKKQVEERDREFCKACNEYLKINDKYEELKKQDRYIDMSRNPAFGKWTEEETNWSQKDTNLITNILKEKTLPTSNEKYIKFYVNENQELKKQVEKLQRINRDLSANMVSMQKEDERVLELCRKQVEELKDKNKQLIFELQDEAKFGLYVSEESEKNQDIVKRLKLKAGKYHGKAGWEFIDDLLQGILKGEKK